MNMQPTSTPAPGAAERKWTVLVYSAADNNLHDDLVKNLQDAEKVGSSDSVAIAAQIDHGGDYGCDRMLIAKKAGADLVEKPQHTSFVQKFLSLFKKQDGFDTGLSSPVLQHMGDVNMSDPKTLADFIEWGTKAYPAEHTLLIMSDHGGAWQGAIQDQGSGGWMSLPKIAEGLQSAQDKTGKKLDIVGFDACLMATTEVVDQLKDKASYLVVSEETEGGAGWQYNEVLTTGKLGKLIKGKDLDLSAEEMAKHIVDNSGKHTDVLPTMSAVDTSKVDGVTQAMTEFAKAIVNTSTKMGVLRSNARASQAYAMDKDISDFARRVAADPRIADTALKTAAQGVVDAVSQAVIAEEHGSDRPESHGLTANLGGAIRFSPSAEYRSLEFAQKTGWDKALDRMGKYWFWPTSLTQQTFAVSTLPGRTEQA